MEGLPGSAPWPVGITCPVLAAGSRAGDGAGVHSCPGGGRHHRQEGAAHQTALPFRQRLHQGDLLFLLPGPGMGEYSASISHPLLCSQTHLASIGAGAYSLWSRSPLCL